MKALSLPILLRAFAAGRRASDVANRNYRSGLALTYHSATLLLVFVILYMKELNTSIQLPSFGFESFTGPSYNNS
jgi:hypothetical protein